MTLKIAVFESDVSATIGSYLCGGMVPKARKMGDPLKARGLILDDGQRRVVLCAVDFCELGGRFHQEFRKQLADAAGTTPQRVVVHTVHQHDAPFLREGMVTVAREAGLNLCDEKWWQKILKRLAVSAQKAVGRFQNVASIGAGKTRASRMASNRRIIGKDGKIWASRMSVTADRKIRSAPEGLIDPWLRTLSFWGEKGELLATLSHYATHPQCSSGRGIISADAPGEALRLLKARYPKAMNIYFTGCAGDVTLGKYSTTDRERNVRVMGQRLATAITSAIRDSKRSRSSDMALGWKQVPLAMPLRWKKSDPAWRQQLEDRNRPEFERVYAALKLGAWEDRRHIARQEVTVLSLGGRRVVYLPGEVFVAYQLFGQSICPDGFIAFAGLGECSVGYIPTAIAFKQGGYEPCDLASYTTPAIEKKLKAVIRRVLTGSM